jgi:hypothetical protein
LVLVFCQEGSGPQIPKIVWWDKWDDAWALTVNGQHCWWVHEQPHPIWSQDPQCFSHKCSKAELNHELAISLFKSQVVYMKRSCPQLDHNLKIFIAKDLEQKLLADAMNATGGDGGCYGHQKSISAPNPHDSAECENVQASCSAPTRDIQWTHEKFVSLSLNNDPQ